MTRCGRCSAGKAEEGDETAMRVRAISGRSARVAGGVADRLARLVGRGRTRAARAGRDAELRWGEGQRWAGRMARGRPGKRTLGWATRGEAAGYTMPAGPGGCGPH